MKALEKESHQGLTIREAFEERERGFISPHGCLSAESRGRVVEEKLCPIRTAFQQDRDRIVYSNAFRRLKYKTQVFLSPLGDQYRTRLTHTLEVAQIARTIARALFLNEDLTEAIALGHDLGHTPFGHSGETILKEIFPNGFYHYQQSLRVVEGLENKGKGLNLTWEVRDGILKHSKGYGRIIPENPKELAATIEGRVVRVADIIAYLNHDLDDAIRSGVIIESQVPDICTQILGCSHPERATTMIRDLIFTSDLTRGARGLYMSDRVYSAMKVLREFLFENVYRSPRIHNEFVKAKKILSELYGFFLENEGMLLQELAKMEMTPYHLESQPTERIVCDFIASLTDRYALQLYEKIFFPSPLV
jgi:dGTPase